MRTRTNKALDAFRRRARANEVEIEVEDILAFASSGKREDAAELRSLAAELGWSRGAGDPERNLPFGIWVDVTCAFLEGGYSAVDAFASDENALSFALGLLSEQKQPESVDTLNQLAKRFTGTQCRTKIGGALNLVCSFHGAPTLSAEAQAESRAWLHELLDGPELSRAIATCALRGVGNADSIARISNLEPLPPPWTGTEKLAIRAIRKRTRTA